MIEKTCENCKYGNHPLDYPLCSGCVNNATDKFVPKDEVWVDVEEYTPDIGQLLVYYSIESGYMVGEYLGEALYRLNGRVYDGGELDGWWRLLPEPPKKEMEKQQCKNT